MRRKWTALVLLVLALLLVSTACFPPRPGHHGRPGRHLPHPPGFPPLP